MINIEDFINKINSVKDLFEKLPYISNEYLNSLQRNTKKDNGIYYTTPSLAYYLITDLFNENEQLINEIENKKFLEPCVGIGNFVFALFQYLINSKARIDFKKIIDNIYVVDNDACAINIYWLLLKKLYKLLFDAELSQEYFNLHISSKGLVFDKEFTTYISIDDIFKHIKFDLIITNPPYKILKAQKNQFQNVEEYEKSRIINKNISKIVKSSFLYSSSGVLNLYKLFTDKIYSEFSNENALLLLLVPNTILNDSTTEKLRCCYFDSSNTMKINIFEENNNFFEGTQGLCSLITKKGSPTTKIKINFNCIPNKQEEFKIINYDVLKQMTGNNKILNISEGDLFRYKQLLQFPKLRDLNFLHNFRGELDLTANKEFIKKEKTDFPLLRGRNIKKFYVKFLNNSEQEYVDNTFLEATSKSIYILENRIACQQISNMNKKERLVFAFVPKSNVLGNSCNFISVDTNDYGIDLYYLLAILNSDLLNWFFSIGNSNNHVSNKEIDMLPIPTSPISKIKNISLMTKKILKSETSKDDYYKLENAILDIYDLNTTSVFESKTSSTNSIMEHFKNDIKFITNVEFDYDILLKMLELKQDTSPQIILKENYPNDTFSQDALKEIINKYKMLHSNYVLNNTSYKLSKLDLEMISNVPQGGNWKNIPMETVQKSKRLLTVTQKGGRTTLYGRIDYNKPCYTITTYFNRPGNGTYVHPTKERCITVREAARIQSFRDSYYFVGSKTDYLKQIGNAVPPLFAKAIVENIKNYIDIKTSIDLFAGAGGLTDGIYQSGVKTLVAVDFEYKACLTLKTNHPEINVICGDLTKKETKEKIYSYVKNKRIDLLAGGPPCQGFSMAGFRNPDDPRNKLFTEYVDVLKNIRPKIFIMENVEGMKTLEHGNIYKEIVSQLRNCGYNVEGKLLFASDFGVPQKRKRLITIGVRNDLAINLDNLFPQKQDSIVTAKDAIGDLEAIPEDTNAEYNRTQLSDYAKSLHDY